ncbi:MAG: AI-2E family transporter [Phycisphaerales bacterium]
MGGNKPPSKKKSTPRPATSTAKVVGSDGSHVDVSIEDPSSDSGPATGLPPAGTPLHRLHLWQFQAVRDAMWVAAVIFILWLGYALSAVTVPLLVALGLAYLFEPIIGWMMKHPRMKFDRLRAVSFILIIFFGSVLIVLALVVPLLIGQTSRLITSVNDGRLRTQFARLEPHVPTMLADDFNSILQIFPEGRRTNRSGTQPDEERSNQGPEGNSANSGVTGQNPDDANTDSTSPTQSPPLLDQGADQRAGQLDRTDEERIRDIVHEVLDERQQELALIAPPAAPADGTGGGMFSIAGRGARTVASVIGWLIGISLLAFLIPFYFFFFSLWYPAVLRFGRSLIPAKNRERSLELISKMDRVVAGFVRGRIVIAIIMGAMLAIGWLICGVPYAILLGIIVGVFSLVPYLAGVGVPLAVGLLFFEQLTLPPDQRGVLLGWFGVIFWPVLVYVIVQIVESYILTPKIAGKATNLDPVTVVVAVLAGGSLLGVYGMLLAIPLAACAKILIVEVIAPRVNEWLQGERADPLPIKQQE